MIRLSNNATRAMEFTSFRKKENITDDELLLAVLKFEAAISKQNGLIFHCLVRNYDNEYANVLFGESVTDLKALSKNFGHLPEVRYFFDLIEMQSVKIEYHEIQKEGFSVPTDFSCIEKGTFSLKDVNNSAEICRISENIENEYLNTFENTQAHFIGEIEDNLYSEVIFGKTLAMTKQICMGYLGNTFCLELLDIADKDTMKLDFWYLIA